MIIKCWGSRGSLPVSGNNYVKYGGDTTCLEIRSKSDDIIIIDAGTGIRRLGNQLLKENRLDYALLFTHAHWDHILGFPYFKPLFNKKTAITVYRCPFPKSYIKKALSGVLAYPYFPVKFNDLTATLTFRDACPQSFTIGSILIEPIALSHPNHANGYKFTEDKKSFIFMTDNELGFQHPGGLSYADYLAFVADADILFHDAEYTDEEYQATHGWGHSAFTATVQLALEAGVKELGLFHLNQDRWDQAMDDIMTTCQTIISTKNQKLTCYPVSCDMQIEL